MNINKYLSELHSGGNLKWKQNYNCNYLTEKIYFNRDSGSLGLWDCRALGLLDSRALGIWGIWGL